VSRELISHNDLVKQGMHVLQNHTNSLFEQFNPYTFTISSTITSMSRDIVVISSETHSSCEKGTFKQLV